jgi:hypothetical protein
MRIFAALALLASLAACSGVTDPAPSVDATFESALLPNGSVADPTVLAEPPVVQVVAGNLRVTGIFPTPTPCEELRGEVAMLGTTARVRITAVTRSVNCVTVTASFSYRLQSRLPAGATRIVVEHGRVFRGATQWFAVVQDVELTR